jgi:hypothetical protein
MKFPIEWHEQCLENMKKNYEREAEAVARMQQRLDRHGIEIEIYRQKIQEAKARGKDGFDSEKFLKRRQPK